MLLSIKSSSTMRLRFLNNLQYLRFNCGGKVWSAKYDLQKIVTLRLRLCQCIRYTIHQMDMCQLDTLKFEETIKLFYLHKQSMLRTQGQIYIRLPLMGEQLLQHWEILLRAVTKLLQHSTKFSIGRYIWGFRFRPQTPPPKKKKSTTSTLFSQAQIHERCSWSVDVWKLENL